MVTLIYYGKLAENTGKYNTNSAYHQTRMTWLLLQHIFLDVFTSNVQDTANSKINNTTQVLIATIAVFTIVVLASLIDISRKSVSKQQTINDLMHLVTRTQEKEDTTCSLIME